MSKYAVFFTLKAEAIARAMQQPSDRVAVVASQVSRYQALSCIDPSLRSAVAAAPVLVACGRSPRAVDRRAFNGPAPSFTARSLAGAAHAPSGRSAEPIPVRVRRWAA